MFEQKCSNAQNSRNISEKLFEASVSELSVPLQHLSKLLTYLSANQREYLAISCLEKRSMFFDFMKTALPSPRIWPFTIQCLSNLLTDLSANQREYLAISCVEKRSMFFLWIF